MILRIWIWVVTFKTRYMKIAILAAAVLISTQLSATGNNSHPSTPAITQPPTTQAFDFVRGHKQGHGYNLQWKLTTNAGIRNFEVQYTYEDPNDRYSNWYVCGIVNNSNLNIFKYTDMNALPGVINYRVVANMNSGATLTSACYTIEITP